MNNQALNETFAIKDVLQFVDGGEAKGGFPLIKVDNEYASAVISLYGAQVLSYKPKKGSELLFVSENAYYQEGKAIKGGIPICWPWFGDDPEGLGRSAHGFVRNRLWNVEKTQHTDDGETLLVLSLEDSADTLAIWPNPFSLRLTITIGSSLTLALQTTNKGDTSFPLTQALHSYFSINNIAETSVLGLSDVQYIDKLSDDQGLVTQEGDVRIDQEVDRIYLNAPSSLQIVDVSAQRNIKLNATGSRSAVVWNPWVDGAKSMADLQDEDYQRFVCVETTNAGTDVVEVIPGVSHTLGMSISSD